MKFFSAAILLGLAISSTNGHAILKFPKDQQEFNGCLTSTPGTPTTSAIAGRPFTVEWAITIPHTSDPGVSVGIRCNPTEQFQMLAQGIDVNTLKTTVTIPPNASGNCELHWRWSSTEDGGSYIECSDISITRSANGTSPTGSTNPPPTTANPTSNVTAGNTTGKKAPSSSSSVAPVLGSVLSVMAGAVMML
ncbi:hypothetical protein BKA69DRAFT_668402 [Paraphysoderma sedebokerense]|nr:hypothetical protein BKA69DRAFT_668402 [Paraphysoderma sedebokerense]